MPFIKIGSSELNNYTYLAKVAKKQKIILSTGMSKLNEVEEAFRVIKKYNSKNYIYYNVPQNILVHQII